MLKEENELLTRVGPGTPCGNLMRRYWHPICAEAQLRENPVRPITILGEELVLFRDRSGQLGLIHNRCAHRAMHLMFGVPEEHGLRCCYHGWLYGHDGRILQTPLEPVESHIKDHVRLKAYPVQELGGLIWAYLGPEPAPLLPRWDLFVREGGFRQIVAHQLPCNWLQVMENRGDLGHAIYLHGRLHQYALERQGRLTDDPLARYNSAMRQQNDRLQRGVYTQYRPVYNEFGFTKGTRESGEPDDVPSWVIGTNPILFPYLLGFGPGNMGIRQSYQLGVPIDDTHTWHMQYFCYTFPPGIEVPRQDLVPYVEVPLTDEKGDYTLDYVLAQDMVAWYAQGEITDRSVEHLGESDQCVVAYRKLLREQIDIVGKGGEPINVFRDPDMAERPEIRVPSRPGYRPFVRPGEPSAAGFYRSNYHKISKGGWPYIDDDADRYCPDRDTIIELYRQTEEMLDRQEAARGTARAVDGGGPGRA
ncbi:MAG TPA: Rieske 2Fe-2S domain-containing protein [Chloroflexota bacterium]|nr:Rieske 2Fe-2S domain-containing protein [Chloroflexota bacterium]